MKDHIDVNNLDGGRTTIRAEELESLAAKLRGCVMLEGDPGFDVARTIWNGMIDRKPSLIVQAAGPADIRAAVDLRVTKGCGWQSVPAGTRSPALPSKRAP